MSADQPPAESSNQKEVDMNLEPLSDRGLRMNQQAATIAVAHQARGEEAWARFLIGHAYWASEPKDLDESEKELDIALHLAAACEARPLAAFCNTTLSGIHARRGDHATAKKFEAAATAIYRELGMQPLPLDTTS